MAARATLVLGRDTEPPGVAQTVWPTFARTHSTISAIEAPTLVTVGALDLVLPPCFSAELVDRIPGSRLVVVRDVGHQPFQEVPEDYNRLLVEFWESVA